MAKNKKNNLNSMSEDIVAFAAITPSPIGVGSSNESYTTSDGLKIFLQFSDLDSSGLLPISGIHDRFKVTKIISGVATTVTPTSYFVDSAYPKTVQLTLNQSDRLIDGLYDGTSGIITAIQSVSVSYTTSTAAGFGTIPFLSDNNTLKNNVAAFTGLGISNRTSEANGPVFLYSYSSTDGKKIYTVFREASPPLLPVSGIGGFSVSQSSSTKNILNAYVLDSTSATDGKIVVLDLEYPLAVDNGSNPATISYNAPTLTSIRLRDSSALGNTAANFSGLAITNNTSETIKPRVTDAYTSTTGTQYIYVTMSEPTFPGSATTGFQVYANNILKPISNVSTGNTTYSGIGVTLYTLQLSTTFNDYDLLELNYNKQNSNFVTDQSANLNQLDSFTNRFYIRNVYNSAPAGDYEDVFSADESFVGTDGKSIYLNFLVNRSEKLLPSSNLTGFYVFVDGQVSPIKSMATTDLGSDGQVKINLHNRIYKGSSVKVGYLKGNLTDAGSKSFASFEPEEIVNNATVDRNDLFDILNWSDDTKNDIRYEFEIGEDTSELFRRSSFNIDTSVILDTEPPKGIVILNSSYRETNPGIEIHKFEAYGNEIENEGVESSFNLTNTTLAWKLSTSNTIELNTLEVKLKVENAILNDSDYVRFDLYSNSIDEKPDVILTAIGKIKFSDIGNTFSSINVSFDEIVTLNGSTQYWIVAYCDSIIAVDTNNDPIVSIAQIVSEGNSIAQSSIDTTSGWLVTNDVSIYYRVTSTSNTNIILESKNYSLDLFEHPIKEVVFNYSDTSYKKYEVIGDSEVNYIHKKLSKIYEDLNNHDNDIYPVVSKIEIGAVSKKPKNYIVEFKTKPTSNWIKLFDTLTDETTLDNIVYNFETPFEISDIRIVYKGDYFTIDSLGNLSITAYDELSDIQEIQVSHFTDFRDADDFENTNSKGFLDFSEGTTDYLNWPIYNNSLNFKPTTGSAINQSTASISFGSKLIVAANNRVYVYFNGSLSSISNTKIVDDNVQITCFAEFKNKLYLGTTNGLIFTSLTGDFWYPVNGSNPLDTSSEYKNIKPIHSMTAFGNKLYIGTSKGSSSNCSIYTYDNLSINKIKDFDSNFEKVSALTSANFHLYVGLGGKYNSQSSSIYIYDNLEWQQSLSTEFDNVESLQYSTTRNSIIAGFRGGNIYELPFVENLPTSWKFIYDIASDLIYSISDDVTGNYLFICGDNKSVVYIKETNSFKVITSYKSTTQGLNLTKRKYNSYGLSYSTNKTDIENYQYQELTLQTSNLDYSNFSSTGFTNNSNFVLDGFVKAKEDGNYKFKLISNMGSNLYIAGISVTSNYSSIGITVENTFESPQTYSLNKDDLLQIKLENFISNNTTPTLKLYWQNVSGIDGYEIIPNQYFNRASKITNILGLNSSYYGVGIDGRVYLFDVENYKTKIKNVYVRYKDEIGNIQGVVLSGNNKLYDVLSDKISLDLNTVENSYQTKGKIYQISKNSNNELQTNVIYTPTTRQYSIYAPDRKLKEVGVYESEPFFVPTLVKWNSMVNLLVNKYALNQQNGKTIVGLDSGTAIKVYVRTGNTKFECLNNSYSSAYEISYINNNSTIPAVETQTINLENYTGKWFQYKFELISATRNLSPEVLSTTITYVAGTASYYFTKIFDTSNYDSNSPVIRRGLLTSNELLNNGTISYGYINSDDPNDIYDFNKYSEIVPNKVFEIDNPNNKIKFGILFTSVGANPSMVYDFAVQLDIGDSNINFMPSL